MKYFKLNVILPALVVSLFFTGCATGPRLRSGPGLQVTNRVPLPVEDTTNLLAKKRVATLSAQPIAVPGSTSTFTIYVPAIDSIRLDGNGKLPMKFQAFIIQIDNSFGKLKLTQQAGSANTGIFTQATGLFSGDETFYLTPASGSEAVHANPIDFKLKASGGVTEDEMIVIIGRAPASGTATPVYDAGIIYTVDVP